MITIHTYLLIKHEDSVVGEELAETDAALYEEFHKVYPVVQYGCLHELFQTRWLQRKHSKRSVFELTINLLPFAKLFLEYAVLYRINMTLERCMQWLVFQPYTFSSCKRSPPKYS